MKSLVSGCVGAVAGLIVGLLIGYLGGNSLARPEPQILPTPSAARPDLSISASAPYAASLLQQSLRQSGFAKNATVVFASPNIVHVNGAFEVNVLGQTTQVMATVGTAVTVQRGRIALAVESVDLGRVAVPAALVQAAVERVRFQVEDQINRTADRALQGTGLRISGIRITAGEITLDLARP